jgi:hypothetical protein
MTAAKPLARYSAIEGRARERLPNHRSYTTTGDVTRAVPSTGRGLARTHSWELGRAQSLPLFSALVDGAKNRGSAAACLKARKRLRGYSQSKAWIGT